MLFPGFLLHHSDSRILDRSEDQPDLRADRQSNWFRSFFPLEGFLRARRPEGCRGWRTAFHRFTQRKKEEESGNQLRAEAKKEGE